MKRFVVYAVLLLLVVACGGGSDDPDPPANQAPEASFTASPLEGEAPLEVSFDAGNSSDSDGTVNGFAWDFGDGSTGEGETASHTFADAGEYTVTLTVTDDDGATASAEQTVTVLEVTPDPTPDPTPENQAPTASFTTTPSSGQAPLIVNFNASASADSDGNITSYSWNFSNENTGEGVTTSFTFVAPGEYTVTLTVTDDDGATDSITGTVTVDEPPEPDPAPDPTPNVDYSGTWAWVGQFRLTGIQYVGYVEYTLPLDDDAERRNVQSGAWYFCGFNVAFCPDNPSGIGLIGEFLSQGQFRLFASFAEGVNDIKLIAFDEDNVIGNEFEDAPSFFGRGIWTFESGNTGDMFLGMTKVEDASGLSLESLKQAVQGADIDKSASQPEQMEQVLEAIQDAFND